MSDPLDGETPSADEAVSSGDQPTDPARLQSAADLDEDELAVDPLEGGLEPPEDWSEVTRRRPTPSEHAEVPDLDQRLSEQRPDFGERAAESADSASAVGPGELSEAPESGGETGTAEEWPIRTNGATVVEAERVESTGLSASSTEGIDATDPEVVERAPEEDAERVEDSER
ncbi:hypothetical protein SAMN04487905_105162 [Actinopolyspora xinjiangensis]|uniref:DUF5709 domain-containing protein n=1 Tax=Actinopolyspora xinjiangensis TaxID=405564 RepID=A0A1H0TMB4_9ACTN|nr:hypothetical protein [Actinopolyspora xinjiangensis]SDP55187.1 hypothetical protein SAMN04487905_105162 [Actinopolyspora xinjiangensis]